MGKRNTVLDVSFETKRLNHLKLLENVCIIFLTGYHKPNYKFLNNGELLGVLY